MLPLQRFIHSFESVSLISFKSKTPKSKTLLEKSFEIEKGLFKTIFTALLHQICNYGPISTHTTVFPNLSMWIQIFFNILIILHRTVFISQKIQILPLNLCIAQKHHNEGSHGLNLCLKPVLREFWNASLCCFLNGFSTDTPLCACLILKRFKADDHNSLRVFLIQHLGVFLSKTFLIHYPILFQLLFLWNF